VEVRKTDEEEVLREVTVKIGLEKINTQKGITVEVLLDSKATELVTSSKFSRKMELKLKKIKRPIYVRNMNKAFNKEELIEYMVDVNIYYQKHKERTKIDAIEEQKWKVILGMP